MTRQTVRNAYSDVRPTQEQKDKMWNAIMAEKDSRPLELRREKPAGGFRFSTIAASLGLVAMLAVVVWFGGSAVLKTKSSPAELTAMDAETNAAYMDQGVRAEAAESADDSAQSAAGDAEDALYRPILEKYVSAIRENKDPGQCSEEDISMLVGFVEGLDGLGWCYRDLDGNGVAELIVSDGNVMYDLYTVENGKAVHLASGFERNSYQLCENGTIKNFGSNSAAESSYIMYRLVGSSLVQEQIVTFDASQDPNNPWFVGFEKTPVSEAEAQAVIDSYPEIVIPITLFSQGEW